LIINAKVHIYSDNKKPIFNLKIKNRFLDDLDTNAGITSGRTQIWIKSIDIFISEKRYLFGLGTQADRLYLVSYLGTDSVKKKDDILSANSSNAIIYSLLSGGIISVTVLILFNYILLIRIYKYFFIKSKKYNFNYNLLNFSIFTYLFLLLRSLVENSFTLFSIDFLIYLQCCMVIIKNINFNYKK
jgi:riboflavin transporter FmnP